MVDEFGSALAELAAALGDDPQPVAVDEHARWQLYERALDRGVAREAIRRALTLDDNAPLVSAAVVRALGTCADLDRESWIELLPPGKEQEFAVRRAAELRIYERLANGDAYVEASEVSGWSQWLQRRLAENAEGRSVLGAIAEHGTTKRVRNLATGRLRDGTAG